MSVNFRKRGRVEDVAEVLDLAVLHKRPKLRRLSVLEVEVAESRMKEKMYKEIIQKLQNEIKAMKEILNGENEEKPVQKSD